MFSRIRSQKSFRYAVLEGMNLIECIEGIWSLT